MTIWILYAALALAALVLLARLDTWRRRRKWARRRARRGGDITAEFGRLLAGFYDDQVDPREWVR